MATLSDTELHQPIMCGFNCDFIERPPERLQSKCSECNCILREPHLVSCCGMKNFCHVCIEEVKYNNCLSPCCNWVAYDIFPNERLKQSLYEFKVSCSNRSRGCQWTGSLGQLDHHLNLKPTKERELEGCQFVVIKCSCFTSFMRYRIKDHKQNDCLKRCYVCPYCKSFEDTYGEVITLHLPECGKVPVGCPNNGCQQTLRREMLDDHIANFCPKTKVDCDFKCFGCGAKSLTRENHQKHINENLATHVGLLSRSVAALEQENKRLKRELECLRITTPTAALNLVMNNLDWHKRNGIPWISPPFYVQSYKVHLKVHVNDHHENSCLSTAIFICLVKGIFDESLKWPFKGTFVVELITIEEETQSCTVLYTARITHESQRVRTEDLLSGKGVTAIHPELMKHVKNDSLHFRISVVQLSITDQAE